MLKLGGRKNGKTLKNKHQPAPRTMTQALGKTIQIFLPDGNIRGVKIAEFTKRQ